MVSMDSTIISAIIGALATILAALLAIRFARNKSDEKVKESEEESDALDPLLEEVRNGPYSLRKATEEDIQWIALKTKELYGNEDSVPLHTKLSWYQKNPNGFWVVVNSHGACVGSCEILPISASTLDLVRGGKIREKDKTQKDIIGVGKAEDRSILYLENFMSVNDRNLPNQWAFKECLIGLRKIISDLNVNPKNTKIYAMPIKEFETAFGKKRSNSERILRELGFYKIVENTVQGYPLYCGDLEALLKRLKPLKGRFKKMKNA